MPKQPSVEIPMLPEPVCISSGATSWLSSLAYQSDSTVLRQLWLSSKKSERLEVEDRGSGGNNVPDIKVSVPVGPCCLILLSRGEILSVAVAADIVSS